MITTYNYIKSKLPMDAEHVHADSVMMFWATADLL